jgi:fumarate reductase subunit D
MKKQIFALFLLLVLLLPMFAGIARIKHLRRRPPDEDEPEV